MITYKYYMQITLQILEESFMHDKNDEHKIAIYQSLCILLEEPCVETFQSLTDDFQKYWFEREPEFVKYFLDYYLNRKGKCNAEIMILVPNMWKRH